MKTISHLRPWAALMMAFLFLFTGTAPALAASEGHEKAVPWEEMEYEHYDPTQFKDQLEELTAAAEDGDEDKALSLYDALYDEFVFIVTQDTICEIHNSQDVNDKYWSDELVYMDTLYTELNDALMVACHQLAESDLADAFAAHVGEDAFQEFLDYEPLTARELELTSRESELINQYNALMDTQDDVIYPYKGEDWTFARLDSEDAQDLSSDEYNDIVYGIYATLAQDVFPIFHEMVSIRTEIAKINGYDDFNHYAYDVLYSRDYTVEQEQELSEEIRQISQQMFDSPVSYMTDTITPTYDTAEEMLAALREYTSRIDPAFTDTWQFMTENHLCDIASGSGRSLGAYTVSLPAYNSGFIFCDELGSYYALSTLFHEFGHFTAEHLSPPANALTSSDSIDVAEIHSTAMELLITEYFDELYEQGADVARFAVLYDALVTVTDQSLFAEFERQIYEDPDMTLEEIGQLYNDLSMEYGYMDMGGPDQSWITIPHFFDSPGYVVSYVPATLAALQIWAAAQEDFQAAVDIYMDILRQGSYDRDYLAVLKQAGLKTFDTAGIASEVCGEALDTLIALEDSILSEPETEAETPEEEGPAEVSDEPEDVLDVTTHGMTSPDADGSGNEKQDVLGIAA